MKVEFLAKRALLASRKAFALKENQGSRKKPAIFRKIVLAILFFLLFLPAFCSEAG